MQRLMLIAGLGQRGHDGLAVHGSYPPGHSLDPDPAMDAAYVGNVHKGRGRDALDGSTIQHGLLHLGETSGGLTEHEHHLGDALVGGQPQGGGGRRQGVVLAGGQVIRQRSGFAAVDAVGDLIGAGEIVGAGHNGVQPHLGGQGVPPIEGSEHDVGAVGNVAEHIAHRLARHDLFGSGFGDGNAGGQRLIRDLKADDLSRVFQIGRQLLVAHPVIGRGFYLFDGVARKRQGLGGGYAPAVGANGVHQIPGLVPDLEHRALQQRPGGQSVGGIIVGGLFRDLDLGGDGGVLPLDQRGLARLDVHRFHLSVGDVPLILQLPQIIASAVRQALDVDIAGIVAGVLPNGGVGAVVEQEGDAINALAGHAVGLMDQDPAERLVFHRQRGGLAVLYRKIMMGGVQLEALCRLDLNGIVAASVQIDVDAAILAGGDGLHQSAVHLPDLEGGAGDALGAVTGRHLDQLQPALGLVEEGQRLGHAALDEDGLRCGIQHVAAHCLGLLGGDGGAGDQIGEDDAAVAVRDVLSVVRPHHLTAGIGDEEGHALDGIGGAVHILLDGQRLLGSVVKRKDLRVLGVDLHRLRLGGRVDGIALNGAGLLRHDGPGDAGDVDLPVGVGGIEAVGGQMPVGIVHIAAPGIGQLKLHPGQRLAGGLVQFTDDEFTSPLVPKGELLHLAARDFDVLGGAVWHTHLKTPSRTAPHLPC